MYGSEWIAPAVGAATQMGGQMAGSYMGQNWAQNATNTSWRRARYMAAHQFQYMKKDLEKAGLNPLLALTGGAVHGAGVQPVPGPVGEGPDFRGVLSDVSDAFRKADFQSSEKEAKEKDNLIRDWSILRERNQASVAEAEVGVKKTQQAMMLQDIEKMREETVNLSHARALMDAQAGSATARSFLDRVEADLRAKEGPRKEVIKNLWEDVGAGTDTLRAWGAQDGRYLQHKWNAIKEMGSEFSRGFSKFREKGRERRDSEDRARSEEKW